MLLRPTMIALTLACTVLTSTMGGGRALAQDSAAGQAVFKTQCGACHSVVGGKNLVGPSLYDVVGRKAGSVTGFRYSPANLTSGKIWDEATLDIYLTSPAQVVPKTIMTYAGLKDPQKRADLIAYLASLH